MFSWGDQSLQIFDWSCPPVGFDLEEFAWIIHWESIDQFLCLNDGKSTEIDVFIDEFLVILSQFTVKVESMNFWIIQEAARGRSLTVVGDTEN